MNYKLIASLFFLLLFSISTISAETAEEKGLAIEKERKSRDSGWSDSEANMSMILINAKGQKNERKMRTKALEILDDGDKGLTIFDQPRDVKGTAFLNFSHALTPDDQWLYLPALKRVKRIASRNKSGPFMGSEFAYEDMSSFEIEKYSYRYLKDELVDGIDCFVVEQIPLDKQSGYTKQLVWIDKQHYRLMKAEFYDRKSSLLKTMTTSQFSLYLDKFWRPSKTTMINAQNGKSTELILHELNFKVGLKDADFNQATLKRAR